MNNVKVTISQEKTLVIEAKIIGIPIFVNSQPILV